MSTLIVSLSTGLVAHVCAAGESAAVVDGVAHVLVEGDVAFSLPSVPSPAIRTATVQAGTDRARLSWDLVADALVVADPPPSPPRAIPPAITRRQLALGLHAAAMLTGAEAIAFAAGTAIPASFAAVIATLPLAQRVPAEITLVSMRDAYRDDPLVDALAAANGLDQVEMDALWRQWGAIP